MLDYMKKGFSQILYLSKNEHLLFISAKDAMKVIRKRLQINPVTSGWRTIGLTLTVC